MAHSKARIETAREAAKAIAALCPALITVNDRAHVHLVEDGAFVDVVLWVPNAERGLA